MACDVVSSPFHETSAFEEDWQKAVGDGSDVSGLGLIAEFNASCEDNSIAFDDNANISNGIDPQLLSANTAASPEPTTDIFDQAFSHDAFTYPDFNQPTPANTPYFNSMEAPCGPVAPIFASSPLRNQLHRRSVSEPPDGFQHHHQPRPHFIPSGPPMTLTRAGHYLGQPKPQHPMPRMMKGLPKNKPYRGQPYAVKNPPPPPSPRGRYDLRNPRPQMVHAHTVGPTSMPHGSYMQSPPPPPPQTYVTSRACTPAPSPVRETMASPGVIDPMLKQMTAEKKVVSIPVDELRSMITEAVRKAVEGIEAAKKSEEGSAVPQNGGVGVQAVDEDEIVVASVEGRESDA